MYGFIAFGGLILVGVFLKTYKNYIFTQENVELGKRTLRRGSSFFTTNGPAKLLPKRDSYMLLQSPLQESTETEQESST